MDTENSLAQEVGKCFTKDKAEKEVIRLGKTNHFYKRQFIQDFETGLQKQAYIISKIIKTY